jgi:hypothetical protein
MELTELCGGCPGALPRSSYRGSPDARKIPISTTYHSSTTSYPGLLQRAIVKVANSFSLQTLHHVRLIRCQL